MPVLRMPVDNTLGDTLGNLGRSLSENFNPLNQLRAYDIQQQMWLRQQQVLQMQRENAARQAAIDQFSHLVPPDKLPEIALMIYQGAPMDQIARRVAFDSGQLIDADTPEALQKNLAFMRQINPNYNFATDGPPVGGKNTQDAYDRWKAAQAGAVAGAEETGKITATRAANAPLVGGYIDDTTPAATANNIKIWNTINPTQQWNQPYPPPVTPKTVQAFADFQVNQAGRTKASEDIGAQTAIQSLVSQYKDDPTQDAWNRMIYSAVNKGAQFEPGLPVPIGPNTTAAYRNALGNRQETQAEAEARGKVLGGGAPSGTTIPTNLPPSSNPALQSTAPAPPAPAPAPASAPAATSTTVSVPNPAAPFAPQTPVVRQTPAGTIIGQTPTEQAATTSTTEANLKDLTQSLTEAQSAKQLLPKLNQLHDLVHLYNAAGPGGQFDAAAVKAFADKWGVSVGDKGAAYQAIQQLLNSEIPDIRQKAGIQRLAGPAIKEEQLIIGNPNMPPNVMDNIIANEKAAADIQVERGNIAFKARYGQGPDALPMDDYAKQSFDLDNTIQQRTNDYRKQYGAIGTADQQPAPVTQPEPPALTVGSIWDAVSHLFGGGPPAPAPAPPAPAPAPTQEFQFDPKTNSIVPVPPGG
jgi:hypothetical protein